MPQSPKGKRPAPATRTSAALEETLPASSTALQAADAPLLSPELPTATVADADPFAQLSSLLGDAAPGAAATAVGAMAPTFANVLRSIGTGVATSQTMMDKGFRKTVDKLKETQIEVVTEVVQELGDDGLPNLVDGPKLVTEKVSLINYVNPTVHAWSKVSLSMDMSVSEITSENGLTFHRDQTSVAGGGGSWGFYGWFDGAGSHTESTQTYQNDMHSTWSSGQVRLDAVLEARHSDKLPVGVEMEIGPKIYFSQGPTREAPAVKGVSRRSVDVTITVQKASAAANPQVSLITSCTPFGCSYASGYTSLTDTSGRTMVTLTRDVPSNAPASPIRGTLTVKLGKMTRTLDVTL